jgi:hypothetical protein
MASRPKGDSGFYGVSFILLLPLSRANVLVENDRAQEGVMSHQVGIWIDHKKAVIVSASAGEITAKTVESEAGPHPHYSGPQEGGGEKKFEERRDRHLDQYYDAVIGQLGQPDALLLFGPGEAKLQLKERLGRSKMLSTRMRPSRVRTR